MPVPGGSGSAPATPGLTYDPVLSRVRLSTRAPSSAAYVRVERSTDQVQWTPVRGATQLVPAAGGQVLVSDYEFAADVPNYYRVRAFWSNGWEIGPSRNDNPYIETDTSGYTGVGGAIVRSTAQAHEGTASLQLTPDGVTAVVQARTVNLPVVAGNWYIGSDWMRTSVARTAGVSIIWRDAGGAILSQTLGATVNMQAGQWTYHEVSGQAPAGATQATFVAASMSGTPPTTHLAHVDEVSFVVIGTIPVFASSITPALGGVWLKSLRNPALNRRITVRDWSEVTRPARRGLFDVKGAAAPVAVTDVRGSGRWTLDVRAADPAEAAAIDALLDDGGTLLVHVPASSTVPGGYVSVGDSSEAHYRGDVPRIRTLSLPMTRVAAPPPEVIP